jgi:hypothetical protein
MTENEKKFETNSPALTNSRKLESKGEISKGEHAQVMQKIKDSGTSSARVKEVKWRR